MNLTDRLAAAIGLGVMRVVATARQVIVNTFRGGLLAAYRAAAVAGAVAATTGATASRPATPVAEIVGWWWKADLGSCCAVCYARHGSVHKLDEPMVSHRNCRCQPMPLHRGDRKPEVGAVLFDRLPAAQQRAVLGPEKVALYQAGKLDLGALVAETDHPQWGKGLRERSLRELVA